MIKLYENEFLIRYNGICCAHLFALFIMNNMSNKIQSKDNYIKITSVSDISIKIIVVIKLLFIQVVYFDNAALTAINI